MSLKRIIKKLFFNRKKNNNTVGTLNEFTRVEWLKNALKKIPEGGVILDAGAGEQQFKPLCKHLKYVSQDFAEYKPEDLDSGLQKPKWDYGKLDIISDIASIPADNASFDAVMCTEVFEHIINPREAVREFSRLLKSDGYLIITAPFCSLTHFAPYHFYSGFNRYFYETVLSQNDFEIIEMVPNGNYFDYIAQELNRIPEVAKTYSKTSVNAKDVTTLNRANNLLQKLADKEAKSSELLCFGYHVIAKKK